ncbi:hypothetical protein KBG31_01020 [Patescibacteria group bacterium]|nr:hypothetical protein [Patescibacteria group bacterium]
MGFGKLSMMFGKKGELNQMENRFFSLQNNQQGQALLFVVVALSVALAVGLSTAFRTLSSVSRVTTTDTSVRVLAVAEGGLEHFLSYSSAELSSAVNTCTTLDYSVANSSCVVNFPPAPTDNVNAHAVVKVERFYGDPEDDFRYTTSVNSGESTTVNLNGYQGNLYVCWLGASDVFYNYFNGATISNWELGSGVSGQGVLCPGNCISGSANAIGSAIINVSTPPSACPAGYHGYTFNIPSGSPGTLQKGITFVPLNNVITISVQNSTGTAFTQQIGYKITSKGELLQDATVTTTKTVSVVRSLPYLTPNMLFGVFGLGGIESSGVYQTP